jgi:hypothetical protein
MFGFERYATVAQSDIQDALLKLEARQRFDSQSGIAAKRRLSPCW